eukprot:g4967.t1
MELTSSKTTTTTTGGGGGGIRVPIHPDSAEKVNDDGDTNVIKRSIHPVSVSWRHVGFSVQDRQILQDLSGDVHSGEICAVMGPSGSGKTTLLDIIADRVDLHKSGRKSNGNVLFNHNASSVFGSVGAYVPQDDSLIGTLTVKETLTFSAMLTYPESISRSESFVAHIIDVMGLSSCANTRVGTIFQKGISGGQKRRLGVGIALVSEPSVLILDEPTSGLDSASAYAVLRHLKELTSRGLTLLLTIHQPSSDLWGLFDKVSFLVDGRTIYFGRGGDHCLGYFKNCGHICPQFSNPSDWIISLINVDFPGHADVDTLVKKWTERETPVLNGGDESTPKASAAAGKVVPATSDTARPNWMSRFVTLSRRNMLEQIRDPGILGVRLAMYTMLALMVGTMFWDVGSDKDDSSINARISIIFYVAAFMVFMSVAVLPFFMMQRDVFVQERANGAFGVSEYVLAKFLTSLPGVFLIALVSTILVVLPSGLNGFGIYLLNLYVSLLVAEAFMCVMASVVPHFIIGIALAAGLFGFFMLVEGFFLVKDDIPPWFIWGYHIAFHTYSFRIFMFNEFEDLGSLDSTRFMTGEDVVKYYAADDTSVLEGFVILLAYLLFFQVLFAAILYRWHTGRR